MTETVGDQLRQARQAQALSLEKVSRETHIRMHYLEALESGNLEALPSPAQGRGFLRTYAAFLGLDPGSLVRQLQSVVAPVEPVGSVKPRAPTEPPPTPEAQVALEAQEIFAHIGQDLANTREQLGFSLEDVERHTHVRVHYLQALESGQLRQLPSPVQGRGMLNNYARFLGMNPEPLLLKFAEGLQSELAARKPAQARPAPGRRRLLPAGLVRLISGDMLLGGALIVILFGFVLWGAIRITSMQASEPVSPTSPSIAEVLAPQETPTLALISPTDGPTAVPDQADTPLPEVPELSPVEAVDGAVQVFVAVRQRAWMRVLVDGQEAFSGRVLAGSAYPFAGDEQIEILTGNGAALQVFFNQQDLGPIGFFGEVINLVFTAEGVLTPTPTLTSTATATVPTTPTPLPSATATP